MVERKCFLSFTFCIYSAMCHLLGQKPSKTQLKATTPTILAQSMALKKLQHDITEFMIYNMEDKRIQQAFLSMSWNRTSTVNVQ